MSVRAELTDLFKAALKIAYPELSEAPVVTPCNNAKFGDYQCNNAMALFGKLKGKEGAPKAPRDVASGILKALPSNTMVVETSLAGPGFINCKLSRVWLAQRINAMLVNGISTWAPHIARKQVIVDFSSPNVAKEMHVGHLRSTILGDTLCKVAAVLDCWCMGARHRGMCIPFLCSTSQIITMVIIIIP